MKPASENKNAEAGPPIAKIFKAEPRAPDGITLINDMLLEILVTLVFKTRAGQTLTVKYEGSPTLALVLHALRKKHLARLQPGGKPRLIRTAGKDRGWGRELILDILAHKESWKPYAGIFAAFAEQNDKDFFESLVRATQKIGQPRKPIFSRRELFLLTNWTQWHHATSVPLDPCWAGVAVHYSGPPWHADPQVPNDRCPPPLRFWADCAVLQLLEKIFPNDQEDEDEILLPDTKKKRKTMDISGLRTMRSRELGLPKVEPPVVLEYLPRGYKVNVPD